MFIVVLFLTSTAFVSAAQVMRVMRAGQGGAELTRNGGFEEIVGDAPSGWRAYENGCATAAGGIGGSQCVCCENRSSSDRYGITQTIELNRTSTAPISVSGWSKAENVSGNADNGYSIYVDIIYSDGTPLWGRNAAFSIGSHGWEKREFIILPEKPIKNLTVYCLFRGHTGKVWFDDVSVREMKAPKGAVLFLNRPMQMMASNASGQGSALAVSTRDGLKLRMTGGAVTSLVAGHREVAVNSSSGFLAYDAAADSGIYSFDPIKGVSSKPASVRGVCRELGLELKADLVEKPNCILVRGRVSDTTGKDRAIALSFALPISAEGWRWADDIRHDRIIGTGNREEFSKTTAVECGTTGAISLYPLGAVYDVRTGIALAIDMAQPAVYRITYHSGTHQLLITYDFGLVRESERFPGSADFAFVIYRFDPQWGFRAAVRKLQDLFPEYFTVRSKDQGIWMPFCDVSTVSGWQDFGFKYHEGDNNLAFDHSNGILAFRYSEPMTWWEPMAKDRPRTLAEALRVRDELRHGPNGYNKTMAALWENAAMADADGTPRPMLLDTPWCNGAVWGFNPNPYLPAAPNEGTLIWNDKVKQDGYGPNVKAPRAGEYLDSIEGYVTPELNYRRDHFRYTTVPLTFSTEAKQPALYKGLAVYELTKWMANDLHGMGKLTFANGVPYRLSFLCPWLDVLGTETNWLSDGKYAPASDEQMNLWRTMAGQKPYLLLMNTDFDTFGPEMMEKYFQRSLFYGMFPSMFSHNAAENVYWQNPKWYERDRQLFKKYIPLIKQVAESGWEPITYATSSNQRIYIERFGSHGKLYLTLMNNSSQPQSGQIAVDMKALGIIGATGFRELINKKEISLSGSAFSVELQSQQVWLVELR
jgi:hypothetical protein